MGGSPAGRLPSVPASTVDRPSSFVRALPRGSTVILAATDLATDLPASVALLEQAGHQVVLLLAGQGRQAAGVLPERTVRLTPECDLAATLEGRG